MWYFLLKIYAYFALNYKPVMKAILSERNIVVVLFIMVLVTFSLAQEDSKKKMTSIYTDTAIEPSSRFLGLSVVIPPAAEKTSPSSHQ